MSVQPMLDAAEAERTALQNQLDALLALPATEGRTALTDDEQEEFEGYVKRIKKSDKQISRFREQVEREQLAANASVPGHKPRASVTSEPSVYAPPGYAARGASYFADMAAVAVAAQRLGGTAIDHVEALERLARNDKEFRVEAGRADTEKRGQFDRFIGSEGGSYESRVNPNTTFGTGGEFVPPLWLVSQFVPLVRPTRVIANRVRNLPLPPGIDVINLPKITVGSLTGIQPAQGAAVPSQDIQTSTVSASVRTLSGQEDISLQLLEQSPLQLDGVIFDDLSRDYDQRLDVQLLAGSGANGQHQGVFTYPTVQAKNWAQTSPTITAANTFNLSSTQFSNLSQSSPTAGTTYGGVLDGITSVQTLRFMSPTAIWAHPRRINYWRVVGVDTQGRPLYVANSYGPFNAMGVDGQQPAMGQGVFGELAGLPVIGDANIPLTFNTTPSGTTALTATGGTNDAIAVVKEDDLILWEGTPKFRALPEILSGTLQVRYQLYCYSAFMPGRFPPSMSLATGSGLAAVSF